MSKKHKILRKIVMIAGTAFTIAGCSGNSTSNYLDDPKTYDLTAPSYTMEVPADAEVSKSYNADYYILKENDKEYGVIVSTNTNPDTVAELINLNNISGYYRSDKTNAIATVYGSGSDLEFSDKYTETTAGGYDAMKSSGKTSTDNNITISYVSYDFFLDSDGKVPAEVFVFSQENDTDALDDLANEVIDSIEYND